LFFIDAKHPHYIGTVPPIPSIHAIRPESNLNSRRSPLKGARFQLICSLVVPSMNFELRTAPDAMQGESESAITRCSLGRLFALINKSGCAHCLLSVRVCICLCVRLQSLAPSAANMFIIRGGGSIVCVSSKRQDIVARRKFGTVAVDAVERRRFSNNPYK
jgi:hypothetical protein